MENVKSVYNGWKEAFFILLFVFVIGIAVILYLLIDHKL